MSWFVGKGRHAVAGVVAYALLIVCVAGVMIPVVGQLAA